MSNLDNYDTTPYTQCGSPLVTLYIYILYLSNLSNYYYLSRRAPIWRQRLNVYTVRVVAFYGGIEDVS